MTTEILCHRPLDQSPLLVRWAQKSSFAGDYQTEAGTVVIKHGHLVGGKSEGVEIILIDTGVCRTLLLPGRGMGIWKMWAGGIEFGWTSPVDGPVNPALVPVMDPDGLGWLEGFDELVVRCGLESNGAPEKNDNGSLRYPLHGRIANLPARDLHVEVNSESGCVEVIGEVLETKLFFKRLRLRSRTGFYANSSAVLITDEVTNDRSVPAIMQLLYHINVGEPVLSDGSTLDIACNELVPKDAVSASEISSWNQMGSPQVGYGERVYFIDPNADESHWSTAILSNAPLNLGFAVSFDTRTLPHFIVWKNTAAKADGYVVGLEPATNFPNHRSFEDSQGRVVTLAPGETKAFQVKLHPLTTPDSVEEQRSRIRQRSASASQNVSHSPKQGWTAGI